jgi:hypothetical protein
MTEIGEVGVRKRRNRQEIKRLVREFETSGLRRSEFCQKHNLAPGTLQRGLKRRRMEVDRQSESKRLVEVKMAGIQRNGSGAGACSLCASSRYFMGTGTFKDKLFGGDWHVGHGVMCQVQGLGLKG